MASLYSALEKPVLIPLMYLTIGLWPLIWLMNWMSYFNGSAHRSTHKSSFSGNETRGQLDFAARFMPHGRPDVLAWGMLGMIAYDATEALARINVPTLVVVGDQDTTTTPEAGAFIVKARSRSGSVTLTPAKHMGLLEHHERLTRSSPSSPEMSVRFGQRVGAGWNLQDGEDGHDQRLDLRIARPIEWLKSRPWGLSVDQPTRDRIDGQSARTRPSTSSAFTVAAPTAVLSKTHHTAADRAAWVNALARAPRYSSGYGEW
jgi:hypothetical protein